MKISIALSTLSLLGVFFQAPSTPPIKMGLWEIKTTLAMSGPGFPADLPARTTTSHGCRTADTYQTFFVDDAAAGCKRSNEVWSPTSYKADFACSHGGRVGTTGRIEVYFDSPTATHGSTDSNGSSEHPNHFHTVSTGRYLGADCGAVAPGKLQTVPQ